MNIGTKLIIGFVAVVLVMGIDGTIVHRVDVLKEFAAGALLGEKAAASNRRYDELPDLPAHVEAINRDWIAGKETSAIREILDSRLSRNLRQFRERSVGERGAGRT